MIHYAKVNLTNGNFAYSFKLENISRKELDKLGLAVAELATITQEGSYVAVLYDFAHEDITLTPYAKFKFMGILELVEKSPQICVAVVTGTKLFTTTLRSFLRLHIPARLGNTIELFTDYTSAVDWLTEKSTR